jgi:hypothetical protein
VQSLSPSRHYATSSPDTEIVWPVTADAAGAQSHATAVATFSGLINFV